MFSKKSLANLATLSSLAVLAACNGGGGTVGGGGGVVGGGGTTGSTYGVYGNPSVTVNEFVNAINRIEGFGKDASYVELYENETYRSMEVGQDDWFVIYDDKFNEHKAVSLQYIRSIVYYDYYSNTTALAEEFRAIENDDILAGELNGDYWGDDYEVVDYSAITDSYWGRNSGFEYEDEAATTDVSLMTAEAQQREFIKTAANISFAFNLPIEKSLSLATIHGKSQQILGKSNGEVSLADAAAIAADAQHLAGVSVAELMAAAKDPAKKAALVQDVAEQLGTSSANLENKIMPALSFLSL